MANPFHLTVLTPEKTVLEQEVTYVHAPGLAGYFGLLAHHAPIIAALMPGELIVRDHAGDTPYALSGGFLEASDNKVVILADALEKASEIDVERARQAEQRAKERVARAGSDASIDQTRARAALARALNRERIAGRR
jgi:F-type H+-transporting ATPase subunit epsilon